MELNVFMRELESALVQRGIPNDTALRHVANLKRTFTSDDLSEIEAIRSPDQIGELADSIASILNRSRAGQIPSQPDYPQSPAENAPIETILPAQNEQEAPLVLPVQEIADRPVQDRIQTGGASGGRQKQAGRDDAYPSDKRYGTEDDYEPSPARRPRKAKAAEPSARNARGSVDDYFEYAPDASPSTKGMILFWVGLFVTMPITLGIAVAVFGVFAVLFVALAALIVASIAVVIALVAGGAVTSLVAVVFGITQLFHIGGGTVIAGIYEIGLGVMVAGIVLFLAVLLYNFAIRFLPWLMTKLGHFLGFLCGKAKDLFLYVRRECYQL